jgi:hypothetical protein
MVTIIFNGKKNEIKSNDEINTILDLKLEIEKILGVPHTEQKILSRGKILHNDDTHSSNKYIVLHSVEEKKIEEPKIERAKCKNSKCNFWGSDQSDGFCSKCHQDLAIKIEKKVNDEKEKKLEQEKIERELIRKERAGICQECKTTKKSYMIMECRCGYFYCQKHIFHRHHNCQYDYIENTKTKMALNAEKMKMRKYENI